MENLKQYLRKDKHWKLQYSCLSINYLCFAEIAANKANVLRLIDVLTVFIKQEQAKVKEVKNMRDGCCKNDNQSWVGKYPIQIYDLIATQKAKEDNRGKMKNKRQAVQYAFEWQKSEDGQQYNHV